MERFRDPAFIEKVFHRYKNADNDFMNSFNLKLAMLFLFGYKPSSNEVKQIMKTTENTDRYGQLTLVEFKRIMTARMQHESQDQDIRNLFQAFDVRCQGFLTLDDILRAFRYVAPNLPESSVRDCFRSTLKTHDGKMSYREFETVMKNSSSSIASFFPS